MKDMRMAIAILPSRSLWPGSSRRRIVIRCGVSAFTATKTRPTTTTTTTTKKKKHRQTQIRSLSIDAAAHPANKTQVYISKSHDALLNLSVEHRLLQVTPPDSTVLLLYVNSPCVVFGRNQNPWLELNLAHLAHLARAARRPNGADRNDGAAVRMIRRRSGGGTVFHDLGNVNFSVICPPLAFDRDKHAEMVVRALKSLGRTGARVNSRHDIVMDGGARGTEQATAYKISGSAYKLSRLRSLHHGTCLLRSPNLSDMSRMLRSPAEPFAKGRGVDSVRSPVMNAELDTAEFQDAVVREFASMYGPCDLQTEFEHVALPDEKLTKGYDELRSRDWIYGQTPRFTFCTHPFPGDARPRPALPFGHNVFLEARHGVIEKFCIRGRRDLDEDQLVSSSLHDVHDWQARLQQAGLAKQDANEVGAWMNLVLGTDFTRIPSPATI